MALTKKRLKTSAVQHEFPDFPPVLRQAITLGRQFQDLLLEFVQLFNADEEILSLHLHPYQVSGCA